MELLGILIVGATLRLKLPQFQSSIRTERELSRQVAWITGTCLAVAISVNTIVQIVFGTDPNGFLRDTISVLIGVPLLAIPIARAMGRAHLELFRAKLQADALGQTDPLTGLPNRRALMEAADREMPDVLALVIVDIDRFKYVNDTHGHLAGDKVLRHVGRMMEASLSEFGSVARIGGEEFAVLCSKTPIDSLMTKLIDFRMVMESTPIAVDGQALQVTISAGVALRAHDDTFDQLFSRADRALYSAKGNGRNRVHFSTPSDGPKDLDGGKFDRLPQEHRRT